MKKQLHKGLLICFLILCMCIIGPQSVLAAAAEHISLWTTSLRYDLEITEPILEEYADGSGMFRANAVCSDRVAGTEIRITVAFYNSKGEMLDCWISSQTLTEQEQISISGTVPDYAAVGVHFFESKTMEPIRPTVMHLLDQQITDSDTQELIAALEKRIKAHDQAINQLTRELDSLLNGYSGGVMLSRNDGQRTVTDGGASNTTTNVRTIITGYTTYMTKDIMFGDADAIEGIILNDFRIEEVAGFEQVELEIQFRNFDSALTDNVVPKSVLVKSYTVPVAPNGLDNYQLVIPIRKSDLAGLNDEFLLGLRILSEGSVVRMEFSNNTTCAVKAKNDEMLPDNPGWCRYAGYYTSKATPSNSRQGFSPDLIFSTVKIRDIHTIVDDTLTKAGYGADAAVVGEALSEVSGDVDRLSHAMEDTVLVEQKEFFNSGRITGVEGIGTIDMNGFGFIILKEWLTKEVTGVRVNLYLNGKTDMPVTCEVLDSSKKVVNNLSVTDTLSSDGEHIFDLSFGADDIEEDFCYLAIYNADRENGYWLGFSTIDTSSEWYQKTSASDIPPIYMYGTQTTWREPTQHPKRYFALLYDEITIVEPEDVATKDYIDEKLSDFNIDPRYDIIQVADEYIAVEGDTLEIFYKSILHAKNPLRYNIHASCAVGTGFQDKFVVPATVTTGVYPLTLTVTNDRGELIDQETFNINVQKKAKSPEKTVNVLCMGASTESDGLWINEFYRRLTQTTSVSVSGAAGPAGDGLSNINFIGKRTTNLGAGYEGFGGWSWGSYISTASSSGSYWVKVTSHSKTVTDQESIYKDAKGILWQLETIEDTQLKMKKYGDASGTMPASGTLTYVSGGIDASDIVFKSATPETGNPFCYNGKLDFKAYCEDIGAEGIDYVYAKLVWNGTPNGTLVSQTNLEKRANQIRTFLNALLADYPDAKLVLTSSPIPSYDGCGTNYTADSVFQNWWYLRDWMYKHQSVIYPMLKAEYPDNIYFCDISAQFDIDHGYPTVTVPYNTRTAQTYKRQSNGVHPTSEGRMQWSDAAYRHFTQMLNSRTNQGAGEDNACTSGHTYENGVCQGCGHALQMGTITKSAWTMSLDSVIYLNYYVKMDGFAEDLDFGTKGGVVIWNGDEKPTASSQLQIGAENCTVVKGMYYNPEYGWGVKSHEIYAKNLGDMVYVRPYVEVADGVYVYGSALGYSPERYCQDMLKNEKERYDTRRVCAALLEYGAAAQLYFDYKTDDLVNEGLDLIDKYELSFDGSYLNGLNVTDHARSLVSTLDGVKKGVTYKKATLNLQGAIRMSVGYDVSLDWTQVEKAEVLFWTEDQIAKVDSLAYELHNYSYKHELWPKTAADTVDLGDYRSLSDHILAKNLGKTMFYCCRIVMKDGTVYRSGLNAYSPESFLSDHLKTATGEIGDLCRKIAVYGEMARQRFS